MSEPKNLLTKKHYIYLASETDEFTAVSELATSLLIIRLTVKLILSEIHLNI
jgi:hypothetical protein